MLPTREKALIGLWRTHDIPSESTPSLTFAGDVVLFTDQNEPPPTSLLESMYRSNFLRNTNGSLPWTALDCPHILVILSILSSFRFKSMTIGFSHLQRTTSVIRTVNVNIYTHPIRSKHGE